MPFNSKQFAYADVKVVLLGRTLEGFLGVKYSVKTDKSRLYGRGKKALSIQSGNEEIEGSLTMVQSEVEALRAAVRAANPLAKITDISFDIVVTYGDTLTAVTDIIRGCEFTEYEKSLKQNDKYMEIELKFIALDIDEGV